MAKSGSRRVADDTKSVQDINTSLAPPDGGWGWVICFSAFFAMVILDGMMFSFGVLFIELQQYFNSDKGETAMVGSALMGIHLLAGEILLFCDDNNES